MQRRLSVGAIFVVVCLAGLGSFSCSRSGRSKAQQGTAAKAVPEDHLASRVLRSKIENVDGQELGNLSDVLINPQNGRIAYAVLATSGFLGFGKRLKAVPAIALSSGTAKQRVVALDISPGMWETAPRLNGPATVSLADPAVASSINRYYAIAEVTNYPGMDMEPRTIQVPTPVGRQGIQSPQLERRSAHLKSARDLPEQRLSDRNHQRFGKIQDLLVDVSGRRPCYAIILVDNARDKGETFAVPLTLLHATDHRGVTLDANRKMFEQAPGFDVASWHKNQLPSGTIFRFGKRYRR